eukprot:SAG31_NODE_3459_length_4250_cov_1.437244_2_plen_100_part_00
MGRQLLVRKQRSQAFHQRGKAAAADYRRGTAGPGVIFLLEIECEYGIIIHPRILLLKFRYELVDLRPPGYNTKFSMRVQLYRYGCTGPEYLNLGTQVAD